MKLYTERSFLPPDEPHVLLLYPFWGRAEGIQLPRPDFADAYAAAGRSRFELVPLEQADVALLPADWKHVLRWDEGVERARAFTERAAAAGKPTVVFYLADAEEDVPLPGAVVFRPSLFRSRRRANEHALPGFQEDLLEYVGELAVRAHRPRPTVGFCGYVFRPHPLGRARALAHLAKRTAYELVDRPLGEDVFVRHRALESLRAQSLVGTDVVVRGEGTYFPEVPIDEWRRRRLEYVRNLAGCDYALCARGAGNWSFRLYEALSLGRIPVLIDTDCVLPYERLVDWDEHVVRVKRRDIPRLAEEVMAFHERLKPGEFEERQRACRRLWEDYLSPQGFFTHFHRHFA